MGLGCVGLSHVSPICPFPFPPLSPILFAFVSFQLEKKHFESQLKDAGCKPSKEEAKTIKADKSQDPSKMPDIPAKKEVAALKAAKKQAKEDGKKPKDEGGGEEGEAHGTSGLQIAIDHPVSGGKSRHQTSTAGEDPPPAAEAGEPPAAAAEEPPADEKGECKNAVNLKLALDDDDDNKAVTDVAQVKAIKPGKTVSQILVPVCDYMPFHAAKSLSDHWKRPIGDTAEMGEDISVGCSQGLGQRIDYKRGVLLLVV